MYPVEPELSIHFDTCAADCCSLLSTIHEIPTATLARTSVSDSAANGCLARIKVEAAGCRQAGAERCNSLKLQRVWSGHRAFAGRRRVRSSGCSIGPQPRNSQV